MIPVASILSLMLLTAGDRVPREHPRHSLLSESTGTTISGVVFDSLTMRGLSGASVQIADARGGEFTRTVSSDDRGAFQITDVPAGTYLLGFFHPKLDSLSLGSQTLRIDVRTEEPVRVRLAIPSPRTLVRTLCGQQALNDSTGLLLGYLRSAVNSMPLSSGTLTVRWTEIIIERNSIQRQTPSVTASTGTTGVFAICGVPTNTPLLLQAASVSDSSGAFEVSVPLSGLLHRDVFLASLTRSKVTVSDSAPAVEMLRGTGRLRGQVVGATGRPIVGARVMVWGTGIETTSNDEGRFSLAALPGGTHTLEVRAVGFAPTQRAVDIVEGTAGSADVELASLGITLDTIRVSAQRVYTSRREAEWERRLKTRSGTGHLIDEAEIEKRRPLVLTDLLRTIPGVQVLPGQRSGEDVFMRGGFAILGSGLCRPDIYIDGARITNDPLFPFNSVVPMSDIRAVEVYPHPALAPVEFQSMSGCGAIILHTGARRRG